MFEDVLKSPVSASRDPQSARSLRLLLDERQAEHQGPFWLVATISAVFAILAALAIFVFPHVGLIRADDPSFWQGTLASLLFWISVSQGMIALSLLTRVAHASWRFPLNRLLDMASLFGVWGILILPFLVICRMKIYSMGGQTFDYAVWRMHGSIIWDAIPSLTIYGIGWALVYLNALPDFAALASRPEASDRVKKFYSRLSGWSTLARDENGKLGWQKSRFIGASHQWRVIKQAEGILTVGGLVAFVMSQTVLAWDFQLSPARGWDSSIFAPIFTESALISGVAMCALMMTIVNKAFPGANLIQERHYDNLGRFMLALGLIWFYFRWCDYITNWYGHIPEEWRIQNWRTVAFPAVFVVQCLGCFILPIFGNMIHRLRVGVRGLCTISLFVLVGVAAMRWLDSVPTFATKYPLNALMPSWGSALVFLGTLGMFVLTYLIGSRYIPLVSWWGLNKERTRTTIKKMGNTNVTVMMEDPAVWRN